MGSLIQGYEYDIFISYRQKDNKGDHWVTEFVGALKTEIEATLKEEISIYFDENPHDGLLESHHVNKSLNRKLKSLILIPIISRTYCDPKSFAWTNEFLPFCKMAKEDSFGMDVTLVSGNVASRVLPVQIHEINREDKALFEREVGEQLRSIDFTFKGHGINRPLTPEDLRSDNLNRNFYRDQINKTANAIEEIIKSLLIVKLESPEAVLRDSHTHSVDPQYSFSKRVWRELQRRNLFRVALVYLVVALLLHQTIVLLIPKFEISEYLLTIGRWVLVLGFPVALLMAWLYEVSPDGFIRTTDPKAIVNPYPASRKKPLTGALPITILALLLIIQYFYFKSSKPQTLMNATIKSIAVLPFENRSRNADDQYIANGITDDILNYLSMISHLKVTNRKNIQQYRGELLPYNQIAQDLEVMALVTGSIQRSGNKIVIRASLIDGITGNFIWGNTLHRTTDDIITVQMEIASQIAEQLEVELNALEKGMLDKKPTNNASAYDYYLRGRSLYYEYNEEANRDAIKQFKKAIEQDKTFAQAWAGLGDAYGQMYGRFAGPYSWTDSSVMAATRAIQLDSTLSDAYKAMAVAFSYKDEFEQAIPLLIKAVELNPSNDQAIGNLGTNYLLMGDLPTALYWEKKGVGMDPKNWIPYQLIGWIYRLLGDLGNAELWLKKSLEIDSLQYDTYELLGYTYVTQGRAQEALRLIPRVLEIDENDTRVLEVAGLIAYFSNDIASAKKYFQLSIDKNKYYKDDYATVSPIGLGQILLNEGNTVEAEVYLNHAVENCMFDINNESKYFEPYYNLACIYAIRNNKKQSLFWLDKAIDLQWVDYVKILRGPYFAAFKEDPDFLKRVEFLKKKTEKMLGKANN